MSTATATPATTRIGQVKARRKGLSAGKALRIACCYMIALLLASPLILMMLNAFKTEADAFTVPPKLIFTPTLDTRSVVHTGYVPALINSVIDVGMSTLLAIALGIPAAFGLAFYKYRGNQNIIFWMLSTTFMPSVGVILPIYVTFNRLQLLDTQTALIIMYTAMNLPLVVLILRSYYLDVPREIIEAALVDGAGTWRLFRSVVGPIARPGIATSALLAIIFAWNEFFFAIMLTGSRAGTIPVFIASSQTSQGLGLASVSAASLLAVAPLVILGWLAQRHLAEGFTLGAVK
ncbi:carbohydrate ABC transporter permease [Micromonospora sp. NPDC005206]|uniref:carbohydrate ABC transporter permease n=1 Tax=Micromonospora sp. NPDC005206 TaxID=3157022 RepID=UPI0033A93415